MNKSIHRPAEESLRPIIQSLAGSQIRGKLIEFNTSCAPIFVQKAALEALRRECEITPPVQGAFAGAYPPAAPAARALPAVPAHKAHR